MYLEMRMTLDPYQDGGKLLDRVFKEYYGPVSFTAVALHSKSRTRCDGGKSSRRRACCAVIRTGSRPRFCGNTCGRSTRPRLQVRTFRSRLDRDIRYLECAAKYMDFVLPYESAVDAGKERPITSKEISDLHRLQKVCWIIRKNSCARAQGEGIWIAALRATKKGLKSGWTRTPPAKLTHVAQMTLRIEDNDVLGHWKAGGHNLSTFR